MEVLMGFEKGVKHAGRPSGSRSKSNFIVSDVINKRFPARIAQIASRRASAVLGASGPGKTNLINYLDGKRLTARESIIGNCFDCCGDYIDGKKDCENPLCIFYPFMPYRLREK
jgi:hypothetical protein